MADNRPHRVPDEPGCLLGPLIMVAAVIDFLLGCVTPEIGSPAMVGAFSGVIAGQLGLLAIWAVLGPQRLLVRWCWSLLVTVLLYGAFVAGIVLAQGPPARFLLESARTALLLPAIVVAVELPLWILKLALGCRIAIPGRADAAAAPAGRQFRLQHLLGTTTAVAVILALARVGLSSLDRSGNPVSFRLWLWLGVVCGVCALGSALSTLPCIWAALIAKNPRASTLIVALYAVLMTALMVIINVLLGTEPNLQMLELFLSLFGAVLFVMLGCLHLARAAGYVLLRAGRGGSPHPAGTPARRDLAAPAAGLGDVLENLETPDRPSPQDPSGDAGDAPGNLGD